MLKQEFDTILRMTAPREFRKFGLTVGSVFLLLGLAFIWREIPGGVPLTALGGITVAMALIWPTHLKYFYRLWMILASMLGWFMTRVLLTLIYYGLFTPFGLILRLLRVKLLDRTIDGKAHSYWLDRSVKPYSPQDSEKQY